MVETVGNGTGNATTYEEAVFMWKTERATLGRVQPYTAERAAQKALLFRPWIGSMPLGAIDSKELSAALIALGKDGGRNGRGLSSATLRAAHIAGSQVFEWAKARGLAKANAFEGVERPHANYRKSRFLTMAQARELAVRMESEAYARMAEANVRGASFALAACIAVATGLRRGEIFALEWDDVNFEANRISISKAIKGGGEVGGPKSSSGIRSVAVGKSLAQLLGEVHDWQSRMLSDRRWPERQWSICDAAGTRASMNAFEHWWRRWTDENGWEGLRFHELRHTHATLLIADGVDVKTVQLRLGHSSADITMSCYAHALPLSDGMAAAALDEKLFE